MAAETTQAPEASPANTWQRLASVDAYRGFVMLLMMAEVLHFGRLSSALPENPIWRFLARQQSHVDWRGCTLHDLIQPSFSFLVGVSVILSLDHRRKRGNPIGSTLAHAAWRALVLIALGIWLRSLGRSQANFTFEDTLTQIGLGFFPLFLIALCSSRVWWASLIILLVGYWAAFALYPTPGPDFDYAKVGVPQGWSEHAEGIAAHWNKNSNLAWKCDTWFLNLFPRQKPFEYNGGGYSTLSFIPTLATSLLGLIAGGWLLGDWPAKRKLGTFALAGTACLAAGFALDQLALCPVVKRIWTPAWVLFSGGWCFLLLALFYALNDLSGRAAWSYPLRVIGMNPIAAYLISHLIEAFIRSNFNTFLGKDFFRLAGDAYEPLFSGIAILSVYWVILFWMERRKIFLRV